MLNKNYEQLKIMLDGNWKFTEKVNFNNEKYLVLTNAGDMIAIYPAEQGEGLEIYYKSSFSLHAQQYERDTAVATFSLIDRLF